VEVLDELRCLFAVIIRAEAFDELDFQNIVVLNQHFCSFELVGIHKPHHYKSKIEMRLQFVPHDKESSIVESVPLKLLPGQIQQDLLVDQVSQLQLADKVRH